MYSNRRSSAWIAFIVFCSQTLSCWPQPTKTDAYFAGGAFSCILADYIINRSNLIAAQNEPSSLGDIFSREWECLKEHCGGINSSFSGSLEDLNKLAAHRQILLGSALALTITEAARTDLMKKGGIIALPAAIIGYYLWANKNRPPSNRRSLGFGDHCNRFSTLSLGTKALSTLAAASTLYSIGYLTDIYLGWSGKKEKEVNHEEKSKNPNKELEEIKNQKLKLEKLKLEKLNQKPPDQVILEKKINRTKSTEVQTTESLENQLKNLMQKNQELTQKYQQTLEHEKQTLTQNHAAAIAQEQATNLVSQRQRETETKTSQQQTQNLQTQRKQTFSEQKRALDQEITRLKTLDHTANQQISALTNANSHLSRQDQEQQERLRTLKNLYQSLIKQHKQATQNHQQTEKNLAQQQSEVQKLQLLNTTSNQENTQLKLTLHQTTQQANSQRDQLQQTTQTEFTKLNGNLIVTAQALSQTKSKLDEKQQELQTMSGQAESKDKKQASTIENQKQEITHLQSQANKQKQQISELLNQINQAAPAFEQLGQEKTELAKNLQTLMLIIGSFKQEGQNFVQTANTTVREKNNQIQNLLQQVAEFQKQLENSQKASSSVMQGIKHTVVMQPVEFPPREREPVCMAAASSPGLTPQPRVSQKGQQTNQLQPQKHDIQTTNEFISQIQQENEILKKQSSTTAAEKEEITKALNKNELQQQALETKFTEQNQLYQTKLQQASTAINSIKTDQERLISTTKQHLDLMHSQLTKPLIELQSKVKKTEIANRTQTQNKFHAPKDNDEDASARYNFEQMQKKLENTENRLVQELQNKKKQIQSMQITLQQKTSEIKQQAEQLQTQKRNIQTTQKNISQTQQKNETLEKQFENIMQRLGYTRAQLANAMKEGIKPGVLENLFKGGTIKKLKKRHQEELQTASITQKSLETQLSEIKKKEGQLKEEKQSLIAMQQQQALAIQQANSQLQNSLAQQNNLAQTAQTAQKEALHNKAQLEAAQKEKTAVKRQLLAKNADIQNQLKVERKKITEEQEFDDYLQAFKLKPTQKPVCPQKPVCQQKPPFQNDRPSGIYNRAEDLKNQHNNYDEKYPEESSDSEDLLTEQKQSQGTLPKTASQNNSLQTPEYSRRTSKKRILRKPITNPSKLKTFNFSDANSLPPPKSEQPKRIKSQETSNTSSAEPKGAPPLPDQDAFSNHRNRPKKRRPSRIGNASRVHPSNIQSITVSKAKGFYPPTPSAPRKTHPRIAQQVKVGNMLSPSQEVISRSTRRKRKKPHSPPIK